MVEWHWSHCLRLPSLPDVFLLWRRWRVAPAASTPDGSDRERTELPVPPWGELVASSARARLHFPRLAARSRLRARRRERSRLPQRYASAACRPTERRAPLLPCRFRPQPAHLQQRQPLPPASSIQSGGLPP